jgi:hypothetical protein
LPIVWRASCQGIVRRVHTQCSRRPMRRSVAVDFKHANHILLHLSVGNGFEWKLHFFLNVRKHCFSSTEFISYIEELKNVTFILHFFAFFAHFYVFKSFLYAYLLLGIIKVSKKYTSNVNCLKFFVLSHKLVIFTKTNGWLYLSVRNSQNLKIHVRYSVKRPYS